MVCSFGGTPRFFLFRHLLLCTSTVATETAVVGSWEGSADALSWQQWDLEESARAELPSGGPGSQPHCLGSDLELTNNLRVQIGMWESMWQ